MPLRADGEGCGYVRYGWYVPGKYTLGFYQAWGQMPDSSQQEGAWFGFDVGLWWMVASIRFDRREGEPGWRLVPSLNWGPW